MVDGMNIRPLVDEQAQKLWLEVAHQRGETIRSGSIDVRAPRRSDFLMVPRSIIQGADSAADHSTLTLPPMVRP